MKQMMASRFGRRGMFERGTKLRDLVIAQKTFHRKISHFRSQFSSKPFVFLRFPQCSKVQIFSHPTVFQVPDNSLGLDFGVFHLLRRFLPSCSVCSAFAHQIKKKLLWKIIFYWYKIGFVVMSNDDKTRKKIIWLCSCRFLCRGQWLFWKN